MKRGKRIKTVTTIYSRFKTSCCTRTNAPISNQTVSNNATTTNANAATATTATNVTATANNSTDETCYITFVDGATGSQGIETDTGLSYNPSSGLLTVGSIDGGTW